MKKILTLVCVSALGGALTLGAYKQFFENPSSNYVSEYQKPNLAIPVSLNSNLKGGYQCRFHNRR